MRARARFDAKRDDDARVRRVRADHHPLRVKRVLSLLWAPPPRTDRGLDDPGPSNSVMKNTAKFRRSGDMWGPTVGYELDRP